MFSKVKMPEDTINYPCLMISKKYKIIVWFTGRGVGRVADAGKGNYFIGENSTGWAMEEFGPFNGTVELSNNKF